MPRLALVTGATGYIGGQLTQRLLDDGWTVRVLSRDYEKAATQQWGERVQIMEGELAAGPALDRALHDVDVAWYLVHAMGDSADFAEADRQMAHDFATAARRASVRRLVYLGGLHPEAEQLSPHLASRKEVGEILLDSGVPTAALQAGVVLGDESASFVMLRHLAERLPLSFGPQWLQNSIQPIAIADMVHYLVAAADLAPEINRSFDVGGPDVVTYAEMMDRYAQALGMGRRLTFTAPVMTPRLAARWIGLVTPVSTAMITPLVESLLHDTVVSKRDIDQHIPRPVAGLTSFEDAVITATQNLDTRRFARIAARAATGMAALLVLAGLVNARKLNWRDVGMHLISAADLAAVSSLVLSDMGEADRPGEQNAYVAVTGAALAAQLAGAVAPRRFRPWLVVAQLAATTDVARRSYTGKKPERVVALLPWLAHAVYHIVRPTIKKRRRS